MQGNTPKNDVIWLKSGPVDIITNRQRFTESQKGVTSVVRSITYSVNRRRLSFTITEICKGDRVNLVYIDVKEEYGRGSSANMNLRFIRNDRYGVLCSIHSKLSGSFELVKHNYRVPPLPETELACYFCRETGDGSFFTLEKKGENADVVERVKGTHAFIAGDETISIKLKITNDRRVGLRVEVDSPVKLTMDYTNRVFSRIEQRLESAIEDDVLAIFRKGTGQLTSLDPDDFD